MTAIDYAALIERLRKDWDDGSTESLLDAIAAIDRLISEDSAELAMSHKTIALQGDDIAQIIAERDTLQEQVKTMRAALEMIVDWDSSWGPYPENNEAWRAMVLVTAREAVSRAIAATEPKETP